MGSRAGIRIDRARLQRVVEDRLPKLVDGCRLRFQPVLKALLRVDGVSEDDLYVGLVNLSVQLAHIGVELEPLELELGNQRRIELLDQARQESERGRTEMREADVRSRIRRLEARKLGDLLVSEGLIDEGRLAAALDSQKRFGGRLGTNLIEQGVLTENELAHFLSVQLGVPCITRLDQIDVAARKLVPAEMARTYRVVPARAEPRELHLAMADPLDLDAIDAVAAHCERRVFPVVAPELLISFALERAYRIPRETRLMEGAAPTSPRLEPLRSGGTRVDPESDPVDATLDLPELGARLTAVETESQILELAQAFAAQRAAVSMVLRADGDIARGWSSRGARITLASLREIRVGVESDPALSRLVIAPSFVDLETSSLRPWLKEAIGVDDGRLLGAPLRRGVDLVGFLLARVRQPRLEQEFDDRFVRMMAASFAMVAARTRILGAISGD